MAPAANRGVNFWLMCITQQSQKMCLSSVEHFIQSLYMSECRCTGGGSVSFRGMFVPSNTDLWERLDASFLNELWIIDMRDDFLLRLAKYYYMVKTFNLIGGQMFPAAPVILVQSTWITSIRSFIYGLLFQTQLGRFAFEWD